MIFGVDTWEEFWIKNPLWMIACLIGIVLGAIFFKRAKKLKDEIKSQKQVFYGYGLFYLMYVITRILFIFSDIARINHSIYYDTFVSGAYIFTAIALFVVIVTIERYLIKQTKKAFTMITLAGLISIIILFIISIFNEGILGILRIINTSMMVLGGLLIIILYIILVKTSIGMLKRNAIFSLSGILILAIGLVFDMDALSDIIPVFISPIIVSIGAILFGIGQKTI
ncbi:MAG: hypothetical protein ACTSRZ_12535 [Promethearchaeota archaeon]